MVASTGAWAQSRGAPMPALYCTVYLVAILVHHCVGWIFAPGGYKAPRRGIPAPRSPAFPGLHRSHCWAVCYWAFCMLLFSPPAAAQQGPLLNGWQAVGGSRSVATGLGGVWYSGTAASGQPANLTPGKGNLAALELRFCCTLHADKARDPHRCGLGLACFPFGFCFCWSACRALSQVRGASCSVRRAGCV